MIGKRFELERETVAVEGRCLNGARPHVALSPRRLPVAIYPSSRAPPQSAAGSQHAPAPAGADDDDPAPSMVPLPVRARTPRAL